MDLYIKIIAGILGFILIISITQFFMSIHPPRFKSGKTPDSFGVKYEDITLKTSDGLKLSGWWIPKNGTNKTIIISHGYPFDKGNVLSSTLFLNGKYNLLYYDFRYFGSSEGKYTSVGHHEQKDFLAAVKYVKSKKAGAIGSFGFSLGASVPLMANSTDVSAIVADSPYASLDNMMRETYRLFPSFTKTPFVWVTKSLARVFLGISMDDVSPEKAIKHAHASILIIHGDKDSQIPVENSLHLYDASNKNRTQLWIVEGVDHGMAHNVIGNRYEVRVLSFFKKNLKQK